MRDRWFCRPITREIGGFVGQSELRVSERCHHSTSRIQPCPWTLPWGLIKFQAVCSLKRNVEQFLFCGTVCWTGILILLIKVNPLFARSSVLVCFKFDSRLCGFMSTWFIGRCYSYNTNCWLLPVIHLINWLLMTTYSHHNAYFANFKLTHTYNHHHIYLVYFLKRFHFDRFNYHALILNFYLNLIINSFILTFFHKYN